MKKIIKVLTLVAIVSFVSASGFAQIVVRVRPARPNTVVINRPPPPSPRHVWVDEEWSPGRSAYVYKGGHWETPPRDMAFYVKGHWRHLRGGWVWVPGHWR